MNIPLSLTFNDVLLEPQESDVRSRKNCDLTTKLTPKVTLKIPIVSSNMDTVTEADMAIEMAKSGGLGIIHRFCSIEDQIKMVMRVKRYMNYKVDDPYTISPHDNIDDFNILAKSRGVGGFIVVDDERHLLGIVTRRDVKFSSTTSVLIKEIMTPLDKLIYSDYRIDLKSAFNMMKNEKVGNLPLVDNYMKVVGLITIKDILRFRQMNLVSTIDDNGQLVVGAAVGVKELDKERVHQLIKAECDVLVVDVAHGHNILCKEMVEWIRKIYPDAQIIAGNVATLEGTKYLHEAGADCVKIGIGPAGVCTTRMMTGCGIPQLTAIMNAYQYSNQMDLPIISDGGHGSIIGNMVKALAAGASCVMLGRTLAGTDESPGQVLVKDGKRVKLLRGMSGFGANMSRRHHIENRDDITDLVPEGVDAYVPYKGKVKGILHQLTGGMSSGLSYCGTHSLKELPNKAKFIRITSAGFANSKSHGVIVL
jgi:IMP dehydrogenase